MGIPIGECRKCERSYECTHRSVEDWVGYIDGDNGKSGIGVTLDEENTYYSDISIAWQKSPCFVYSFEELSKPTLEAKSARETIALETGCLAMWLVAMRNNQTENLGDRLVELGEDIAQSLRK